MVQADIYGELHDLIKDIEQMGRPSNIDDPGKLARNAIMTIKSVGTKLTNQESHHDSR